MYELAKSKTRMGYYSDKYKEHVNFTNAILFSKLYDLLSIEKNMLGDF